jgi:predicted Zn-dependent protease
VFGQFGSLKKAFDTARGLSDLKITEEEERALGEAISQRIREVYGVQQDEATTRYVTLVGRVVAEKSDRPNLDYQFIILDSDSTNAFAAPGGLIHITRGALAVMKSEAELAGVLAHEIAHVTEKHTIKGLQKSKGIKLAEDQTSLTGDSAVFEQVVNKATEAVLQGWSRSEELEADEKGVHIAAKVHYHPNGLPDFLKTLQARYSQREGRAGIFASHPETKERIDKLESRIRKKKLERNAAIELAERMAKNVSYELSPYAGSGASVEGARGLAGSESDEKKKDEDEDKSGGFMAKLSNPFGSGKKEERAEVTGSAAARGVETELGTEEPGNPNLVPVKVTPEEVRRFKEEGGLA